MEGVYFITSNPGKYREVRRIGEEFGIEVGWIEIEYYEPQGDSLEHIARKSAEIIREKIKDPFIIEDSGLFIDHLNGFPGVYSSYVFRTIGNEGVLKLMEGVKNRNAVFRSVVAYCENDRIKLFSGEVSGVITSRQRGRDGFGYDPIFEVNGRTFAEMGKDKNLISHRRRAMEKFLKWYMNRSESG